MRDITLDANAPRASLPFVELHVIDGLALSVFSSLRSSSRLSVGSHHHARRDCRLAGSFLHSFVGAGVNLRKGNHISIRIVPLHWVVLAVKLTAGFPVLRVTFG